MKSLETGNTHVGSTTPPEMQVFEAERPWPQMPDSHASLAQILDEVQVQRW